MSDPDPDPAPSAVDRLRQVVVLVEGDSDAVVVETLVRARGLGQHLGGSGPAAGGLRIEAMGGITNIARDLTRLRSADPAVEILGLYDAAEERYVIGALRRAGAGKVDRRDLPGHGFHVCEGDLEDELIRSLGEDVVVDALEELGDVVRFRTFRNQPEWRDRDLADQLHRFAGSRSGRKYALAESLARRLTPDTTPEPLSLLVDRIAELLESA